MYTHIVHQNPHHIVLHSLSVVLPLQPFRTPLFPSFPRLPLVAVLLLLRRVSPKRVLPDLLWTKTWAMNIRQYMIRRKKIQEDGMVSHL